MLVRVRMDLAFNVTNQTQAGALRNAVVPFINHAVNIREGEVDEEIGYIEAENCGHDESPPLPCVLLARWEVNRGRVA